MPDQEVQELAERIERKTDRILAASGSMFLIWQVTYFLVFDRSAGALRAVDMVASFGFIAWAAALLMLIATGGGVFTKKEVRDILDDELARAYRAHAYRNAFWALMIISLGAYVAAQITDIPARPLAHVILSAGVLVAVATLAYLRRK